MKTDTDIKLETGTGGLRLAGILVFLILFVGVGVWSYLARIEGAVIASGTVVVSGQSKTIQHLDGGIVENILVSNGDFVNAGDSLITLDQTELRANFDIILNRLRESITRRDRLNAEQNGLSRIKWDTETFARFDLQPSESIRDSQNKIFQARRKTRNGQTSQLRERQAQLVDQIDGMNIIIASRDKQISTL